MDKVNEYHSPLYEYLKTNRGAGHTTLLLDGAMNAQYPFLILGKDMAHAKDLHNRSRNRFGVPRPMNAVDAFRGYNYPVMVDNFVITETCEGYIRTIRDYREINQRLREEIEKKEKAIKKLNNLPFWIRAIKPLYRRAIRKANGEDKSK